MRDTVGLRGKESTHCNVGLQVGNVPKPMQYLLDHLQLKTQAIQRKDQQILAL